MLNYSYRNGAPAPVPDSPGAQSEIEYLLALVLLLPLSSTNNETIVCITLSILMLNPYEFTGLTDMDKNNPDYPPGSEPWFENASSIEASRMSNNDGSFGMLNYSYGFRRADSISHRVYTGWHRRVLLQPGCIAMVIW
jgi:hypothetical protein